LNAASANAFLKTLEEPPGDSLIILITAMPQSLLPTIRSRCQEIVFHLLPRHILAAALARKRGLSEENAWFLAALAQGSLGRGLEMDVDAEKTLRDEVLALWSGLGNLGPGGTLLSAEALGKDRERLERLLDIGIEWLRDAVVYRETNEERLLVNGGRTDLLRQWCEHRPLPGMLLDLELFTSSRKLLDRRISAQLVAENLLLKLGYARA
jgi:DNA polymerase-3 subunit delta'